MVLQGLSFRLTSLIIRIKSCCSQSFINDHFSPAHSDSFYVLKLCQLFNINLRTDDVNSLFCSNKFGEVIENFVGSRHTLSGRKMNCECASTRDELSSSAGSVK